MSAHVTDTLSWRRGTRSQKLVSRFLGTSELSFGHAGCEVGALERAGEIFLGSGARRVVWEGMECPGNGGSWGRE